MTSNTFIKSIRILLSPVIFLIVLLAVSLGPGPLLLITGLLVKFGRFLAEGRGVDVPWWVVFGWVTIPFFITLDFIDTGNLINH